MPSPVTIPAIGNTWTRENIPLDAYMEAGSATQAPGFGSARMLAWQVLPQGVSVKAFGAVGDGVTDDTAAIQAAIAYCKATFGTEQKQLNFPAASGVGYRVTGTLNFGDATSGLGSNWLVLGEKNVLLVLDATIAAGAVMSFYNASQIGRYNRVIGVSIFTDTGGSRAKWGIDFRNNTQYRLSDFRIVRGFSDIGLYLTGSYDGLVENVAIAADAAVDYTAASSLGYAPLLYIGNAANALSVINCNLDGALALGTTGCEIQGAIRGVTMLGTAFQLNRLEGLRISNTQVEGVKIAGCYFEGNANAGGTAKDIRISNTKCCGISIENSFLNSDNYGLYLDTGTIIGLMVRGCLFDNNDSLSVFRNTAKLVDSVFDRNIYKDQTYGLLPLNILPASTSGTMAVGDVFNVSVKGTSTFAAALYGMSGDYPGTNQANLITQQPNLWVNVSATETIDNKGLKFGHPVTEVSATNASGAIRFDIPSAGLEGRIITFAIWIKRTAGSGNPYVRIAQNAGGTDRLCDYTKPSSYTVTDWNLWLCYYPVHATSTKPIGIAIEVADTVTAQVCAPIARVGMLSTEELLATPAPLQNYLIGTGTPVGSVTPDFVGQDYLDSSGSTPVWYRAAGATDADWVALN